MPNTQIQPTEEKKVDFRIYLGIILFRWQIIAVCFLYCLLAGVVYIYLAPQKFGSSCNIIIYRDPLVTSTDYKEEMASLRTHTYMLRKGKLIERTISNLVDEYAEKLGGRHKMTPKISVSMNRAIRGMLRVSVQSPNREYAEAFLKLLLKEHEDEWQSLQRRNRDSAAVMLEQELENLKEQIRSAEDDVIEYQRLNDIARVEARGTMESRYLMALMMWRNKLTTERMMLEAQYPALKDAGATVISAVGSLTRRTGEVNPLEEDEDGNIIPGKDESDPEDLFEEDEDLKGFQELRVDLQRLEEEKLKLARDLKPDNPTLKKVRDRIEEIRDQLKMAAEIQMRKLEDRHKALTIQLEAIETAEYKWQAKNLMASQRQAEYKRVAAIVTRFEANYAGLYARLHDMRVAEELKAERFVVEEVHTPNDPVWPDPLKILLVALGGGLGLGFGLSFILQVMDNKVQSTKDVENILGLPFLGGIPFWAHSGLEAAIRPIVTEEHSTGAIEAYRALRTSVLGELNKKNEKVLIITSADSREGKTLTALNMAIMVAQMGKRVLLIDADLRRGRLHRSLGLDREPGMADILREKGSFKDVVQPARIENLFLVPAGGSTEDSAELLQSADITGLIVEIQDEYDYIIIDTSPVLRVTDTVILSTQGIGQVLYVARVNHTPKPMIRYSLDMLKDANILGLVMNSIELHKISSLYYAYQYPNYAYYSNAYTYGYNYYYYDDKDRGRRSQSPTALREKIRKTGRRFASKFLPKD